MCLSGIRPANAALWRNVTLKQRRRTMSSRSGNLYEIFNSYFLDVLSWQNNNKRQCVNQNLETIKCFIFGAVTVTYHFHTTCKKAQTKIIS